MVSPILPPSGSPFILSGLSTNPSTSLTFRKDSLNLFDFLQLIDTTSVQNKETTFNNQYTQALVNREYFLTVAQDLGALAEKYKQVVNYSDNYAFVTVNHNASVGVVNSGITTYNNAIDETHHQIDIMNDAINTINGIASPTPSDIADYNAAVAAFNAYMSSTGNPALLAYTNGPASFYNTQTNLSNTVLIPQINGIIDELNLNIPHLDPLTPATAPAGGAAIPPLGSYSGGTIPTLTNYDPLDPLDPLPPPLPQEDIVQTYFMPYALSLLAAMGLTSKKLSDQDQLIAFINYFIKQGFKLDPAKVDSYITESLKPTIPTTGGTSSGSTVNLMIGTDNPNILIILSSALFKAVSVKASTPIPPQIYDQINAMAAALIARIGASAGLSVVNQLGDSLKSISADNPAIDVTLSAAILQSILTTVSEGLNSKDAFAKILKGIPGISDGEAADLASRLLDAQNLSLLLLGGSSVAAAVQNPNLVQNLINVTISAPNGDSIDGYVTEGGLSTSKPLPPSAAANAVSNLNTVLKNPQNVNSLQNQLSSLLSQIKPSSFAPDTASTSLTNAITALPPNATSGQLQQQLQAELLKKNLTEEQAGFIAENISLTSTLFIPAPQAVNQGNLSPGQVINQLQANVQNVLKADVTNSLPKIVSQTLIESLTDTKNPNSWASLLVTVNNNLKQYNDKQVDEEVANLQNEHVKPNIDLAVMVGKLRDPANNIILSFQTGLMYDHAIPTNWQRPLSIQV